MRQSHRLFSLLGGGAAALLAGFVAPMAPGHAEGAVDGGPYETCNGAVCLVMGDPRDGDWQYGGVRPLFTDFKGDQPYTVDVGQGGDSVVAGTYHIKVEDFATPLFTYSEYHYGDFVPNADAPAGVDLGGFADMSGAAVYKVNLLDSGYSLLSITGVGPHDMGYLVIGTPDLTNTLAYTSTSSADYIQKGDAAPEFLWNSLFHPFFPTAPDYVVPADPFAGLDFNPADYPDWDISGLIASL